MSMKTFEVDPGDPHNDQLTAQAGEDLAGQLVSVHGVLDQAEAKDAPLAAVLAVMAQSMIEDEAMPRERLATLLALALIRIAAENRM